MNNQKCQKTKLHGTPTTKELKKQSTRSIGSVEGRQADGQTERTPAGWWTTRAGLAETTLSKAAADWTAQRGRGWLREPRARWWTRQVGLAEWETETQS